MKLMTPAVQVTNTLLSPMAATELLPSAKAYWGTPMPKMFTVSPWPKVVTLPLLTLAMSLSP